MSIGFWQIAIVVVLVVLLFGRGKISSLMGDVAKGIKSFKKGMKDPTQDQSDSISSQDQSSSEEDSDKKYQQLMKEHQVLKGQLEKFDQEVKNKFDNKNDFNQKIDELNQETENLIDEIDKWQT